MALELYYDLTDAVDRALRETTVIDPEDDTVATMPNGDGIPVWVGPEEIVAHIVGRVMAVFEVHRRL